MRRTELGPTSYIVRLALLKSQRGLCLTVCALRCKRERSKNFPASLKSTRRLSVAARNMHKGRRKATGTGMGGKIAVMGLLERHGGEVRTMVVGGTRRHHLMPNVMSQVESGSRVFTDAHSSYIGLDSQYVHNVINHAERYVDGQVDTNGIENFWSLLAVDQRYVC